MVTILSLDCATRTCGVAVLSQEDTKPIKLLHASAMKLDTADSLSKRLVEFHTNILTLVRVHRPDLMSIEDLKFGPGAPNFGALTKVAMSIGVAQMTAAMAGFEPILITASTVRARIDNKAKKNKKDETRKIVNTKFKNDLIQCGFIDGLLKNDHDISDAIALGWVALATWKRD